MNFIFVRKITTKNRNKRKTAILSHIFYDTVRRKVQKSVTATVISESWNQSYSSNESASISLMRVIFEK